MRRRFITFGLAALLITGLLAPPVGSKPKRCSDEMTWAYDQETARATFRIDLPRCWKGKNTYKVKAWIERHDPTEADPQRNVATRRCSPRKVCRISIEIDHPTTEVASYRASIEYRPTPDSAEISHRVLTCTSADSISRCDQP